jgi:hypothetical protein
MRRERLIRATILRKLFSLSPWERASAHTDASQSDTCVISDLQLCEHAACGINRIADIVFAVRDRHKAGFKG